MRSSRGRRAAGLALIAALAACLPRASEGDAPQPAGTATVWVARRYVGPQQCDPAPKPEPTPDRILAAAGIPVHGLRADVPAVTCDGCGCPTLTGTYYLAVARADVDRALALGFERREPPADP